VNATVANEASSGGVPRAESGDLDLLRLPYRVSRLPLPRVRLVELRGTKGRFSQERLDAGEVAQIEVDNTSLKITGELDDGTKFHTTGGGDSGLVSDDIERDRGQGVEIGFKTPSNNWSERRRSISIAAWARSRSLVKYRTSTMTSTDTPPRVLAKISWVSRSALGPVSAEKIDHTRMTK